MNMLVCTINEIWSMSSSLTSIIEDVEHLKVMTGSLTASEVELQILAGELLREAHIHLLSVTEKRHSPDLLSIKLSTIHEKHAGVMKKYAEVFLEELQAATKDLPKA